MEIKPTADDVQEATCSACQKVMPARELIDHVLSAHPKVIQPFHPKEKAEDKATPFTFTPIDPKSVVEREISADKRPFVKHTRMDKVMIHCHNLAVLRWGTVGETAPDDIRIILVPGEDVYIGPGERTVEHADRCSWNAMVMIAHRPHSDTIGRHAVNRYSYGELAGNGDTPELALDSLLEGLITAHRAVDERRESALVRATLIASALRVAPPMAGGGMAPQAPVPAPPAA